MADISDDELDGQRNALNDDRDVMPSGDSEESMDVASDRTSQTLRVEPKGGVMRQSVEEEEVKLEDQLMITGKELPVPSPVTLTDDEMVSEKGSIDNEVVVTVKFRTEFNETMTIAFKLHSKIVEVKERLAKIFRLDIDGLKLYYEESECDDLVPLSGLGAEPLGTIELGIRSTDPYRVLAPAEFSRYIPIVDVITVRVPRDTGGFKDVIVEIENQCFTKKWLGGYRHRYTKTEYHHAEVQTLPRPRPPNSLPQRCRDTQTPFFPVKEIAVGTRPSKATQIWPIDHHVPDINDKIVATDPGRFTSKKKTAALIRLVAVVAMILRYYKRFTERRVKRKQEEHERDRSNNEKKLKELVERRAAEVKAQVTGSELPLNRNDFYLLYLLIGKWWKREMYKIANTKSGESKTAALLNLLNREISLITVVEDQRIEAKKRISLKRDMRFLEASARPIVFRNNKGVASTIDTLATQQAREYQEIITSFLNMNVSKERRIEALHTVKRLIKSYGHYEHTQEILSLLDRECCLLQLGVCGEQLTGLRDRVVQLLFYFLHRYIVDPNTKNFKDGLRTDNSLYCCLHCRKLKPASDFNIHVKMTSLSTCRSCEWIKNVGLERIDFSPFVRLLGHVRQSEMQNACYTSVCYVLQVVGMYYLTKQIWCCRSILSDVQDLKILRMVRFRRHEDWSPWNCILLTVEESLAHLNVDNVYEFYSRPFLDKVRWRHVRAKNHFLPLLMTDKMIRETNPWSASQDSRASSQSTNVQTIE